MVMEKGGASMVLDSAPLPPCRLEGNGALAGICAESGFRKSGIESEIADRVADKPPRIRP